jgi:hypothetical protein
VVGNEVTSSKCLNKRSGADPGAMGMTFLFFSLLASLLGFFNETSEIKVDKRVMLVLKTSPSNDVWCLIVLPKLFREIFFCVLLLKGFSWDGRHSLADFGLQSFLKGRHL